MTAATEKRKILSVEIATGEGIGQQAGRTVTFHNVDRVRYDDGTETYKCRWPGCTDERESPRSVAKHYGSVHGTKTRKEPVQALAPWTDKELEQVLAARAFAMTFSEREWVEQAVLTLGATTPQRNWTPGLFMLALDAAGERFGLQELPVPAPLAIKPQSDVQQELAVMQTIADSLSVLGERAQKRVLRWVIDRFQEGDN